ncbi:MAG TPA: MFS transporter [Candidatus Corynebacterium avicola]|uniref:MFS transporter n=1 Tax=Candidatus Corynebacterium avicola TaxID=2838527 RepID=A0A9D1UKU2_9CORY|nr:MFS transporter [Candidatus Corynebacterium avicola]
MPRWLFALLFAALILYTDDYVIAGILPELAGDLGVSEAQAGQLVTVFSLTLALSSPVAAVVLANVRRSTLFTITLTVFAVANLAAAAVSDFWALMVLRVIAALCAGASTPAVFAWTAAQAPPEKIGRYISIVALGVTGAIALGVPAGTLIAQAVSWRGSFVVLAVCALLAIVMIRSTMVSDVQGEESVPIGRQLRALGSAPVALTLGVNVVAMSGSMMAFTYFAPFLAGAVPDHELRAVTFALSGLGGIVGVWFGGVLTDRIGALRTIVVALLTLALGCAGSWLLWLVAPLESLPLIVVLVSLGAVQALGAFSLSPALTARLATTAGDGSNAAIALNTSGTYLGVTIAGAVGGAVLAGGNAGNVVATATLIVLVAAGMFAASTRVAK